MTDLAVILAAGEGPHMGSSLPKVMHRVGGNTLLGHVLNAAECAELSHLAVVVAPDLPEVGSHVRRISRRAALHIQAKPLGTAHAVLAARSAIEQWQPKRVIVLFGDSPLVTPATIKRMLRALDNGSWVAVAGFVPSAERGYGRLVMDGNELDAIREVKDATSEQMKSRLVNGGLMALRGDVCMGMLERIGNRNKAREYYLTDVVEQARARGARVAVVELAEADVLGVNTPAELELVAQVLRARAAKARPFSMDTISQ